MPKPVAVDASPIIILAKAGVLDLLRIAGRPIQVPRPVILEVRKAGPNDPAVLALAQTPWLVPVDPGPEPAIVTSFQLGAGEAAVLTWALAHPGTEAVIDDPKARRAARTLGIAHRGCLGLVLVARQLAVIPLARPLLEQLRRSGLRLSDRIMNAALAKVGE